MICVMTAAEQDRRMGELLDNLAALDLRRLAREHPTGGYASGKEAWEAEKAEVQRVRYAGQLAAIEAHKRDAPPGGRSPEDQAARYLAAIPGAVSGAGLDIALRRAAVALVVGFALPEVVALGMLAREYAPRCQPTPPMHELRRKVRGAARSSRLKFGYLLQGAER